MTNLGTAVNTAVGLGAKYVSNSYSGHRVLQRLHLQLVPYFKSPRRRHHRQLRRQRLRRRITGRVQLRDSHGSLGP